MGEARHGWLIALIVAVVALAGSGSHAQAETRSLKLYFIHTKERAEIVYKRNGRYDQDGLNKINRFLRDWRRNEPAKMDPRLLDLVWSVYKSVGARDYIHVVSAYRSPATNAALRSRSSGVAEKSQHMLGKAMDFYIPGVALSKLRAAAFKAEGGGVGYYPTSGSPFVHLDVGNVRAWPRMSRGELMALFPDGKTIHVPTDGKPLPGFKQALAAYESRKKSGGQVQVASFGNSGSGSADNRTVASFLANVFRGGGADQEEDEAPAVAAAPAQRTAPAAQAAPEPSRKETIVAALPERNVPLPGVAPRPLVDVGAPAKPLIEGMPAEEQATVSEEAAELLAASVPLPSWRPVDAPVSVAAAEQMPAEGASADVPTPANLALAAIAAERPRDGGSEAIQDLLAMSASEARADVIINSAPVPELRPGQSPAGVDTAKAEPASDAGDVFVLAALPELKERPVAADLPVVKAVPEPQLASLDASPRVAAIRREPGSSVASALESGVRTTGKGARPSAANVRPDPKAVVVPVGHELTRWAFKRDVTVATAGGKNVQDKAHSLVWSSPDTVYTSGFQQASVNAADVRRFTGKAVTFMSVARFGTN